LYTGAVSEWWQRLAGGALLAWCLVAAVAGVLDARTRARDAMADLDAQFRALAPLLPSAGEVGFLEPFEAPGSPEAVRLHYAAQYALAPRVVVERLGLEFLIVARGAAREDDRRLEGYTRLATTPAGHRLFRRLR
jgi:hypothetical protein